MLCDCIVFVSFVEGLVSKSHYEEWKTLVRDGSERQQTDGLVVVKCQTQLNHEQFLVIVKVCVITVSVFCSSHTYRWQGIEARTRWKNQ